MIALPLAMKMDGAVVLTKKLKHCVSACRFMARSLISNQVDFMGHEYFSAKLAVMVRDHHEHIVMNNYYQL